VGRDHRHSAVPALLSREEMKVLRACQQDGGLQDRTREGGRLAVQHKASRETKEKEIYSDEIDRDRLNDEKFLGSGLKYFIVAVSDALKEFTVGANVGDINFSQCRAVAPRIYA
jgi:hypothetical protein